MQLIYFTAPWCVPCKAFGLIMAQVTSVPVIRVDVDQTPGIATAYNVSSVPTVILVDGPHEFARFSGAKSLEFVNKFIEDGKGG